MELCKYLNVNNVDIQSNTGVIYIHIFMYICSYDVWIKPYKHLIDM